ncbi:GNAT family N-acetyltransferase [Jannaschia donghaensis]|uniref:FemAB-related protein, PEP-CTERM system-associated n=1 Tax=Jannaschia donghaensis TaxID=420998 RepID=A0A0M6YHD1_9RHOB|nr:GNAT family N-acetyltransferase [Jannaschia donghaensis]CTQ48913.1 FemAB-related protein, PEP-CTERM system-associated [Jannaschia donghaensis]
MSATEIELHVLPSLSRIDAEEWDACACPEAADGGPPNDPFTTHRFLYALEQSGSVGPGSGWHPQYLTAHKDGQVIACAPLYAKEHSQGEYIFDHNWAHGFERAGGDYYPKLQLAVPFTPATGRRFLLRPGHEEVGFQALVKGAVQLTDDNGLSSLHITFCTDDERAAGVELGLMERSSQQYHWFNDGYASFDDFLAALSSRKRKTIRRERAVAQGFGGTIRAYTGDTLRPEHWDAFWRFYQDTGARKWGTPYLARDFFDRVQDTMRDDVLLVLAERDGVPVAGALNFIGRDVLYGRYWGSAEHHPMLHFELCYYQAIDHAIARGQSRVEAGAQGDHKLARGYLPVTCNSLHHIPNEGFRRAIAQYLQAEARAVEEDIEVLTSYGPFKTTTMEEQE